MIFADFLKQLLSFDPDNRLTPTKAIHHPFIIDNFNTDLLKNEKIFSKIYYPREELDVDYIKENNRYYNSNRMDIVIKITYILDIIGKRNELSLVIKYLDIIVSKKGLLSDYEISRFIIIIICIIESYINDDEYENNVIEYYCSLFNIPNISDKDIWLLTTHVLELLDCNLTMLTPQICLDIFGINNQTYFSKELVRLFSVLSFIQSLSTNLLDIDPVIIFENNMILLKQYLSEKQLFLIQNYDINNKIKNETKNIINKLLINHTSHIYLEYIEYLKNINCYKSLEILSKLLE